MFALPSPASGSKVFLKQFFKIVIYVFAVNEIQRERATENSCEMLESKHFSKPIRQSLTIKKINQ